VSLTRPSNHARAEIKPQTTDRIQSSQQISGTTAPLEHAAAFGDMMPEMPQQLRMESPLPSVQSPIKIGRPVEMFSQGQLRGRSRHGIRWRAGRNGNREIQG
jgi:hypothetical protein